MEEKRGFLDEAKVFVSKAGKAVVSGAKRAIKPAIYATVTFAVGAIGYQAGKNDWFGSSAKWDELESTNDDFAGVAEVVSDNMSEAEVTNF